MQILSGWVTGLLQWDGSSSSDKKPITSALCPVTTDSETGIPRLLLSQHWYDSVTRLPYDENTRRLMSKQDLCDTSGLWITTLTHYRRGNNSRVGASEAVFMQSHLMGEMATSEPCYKINLESRTFTSGHINQCCPEGDSPGNGTSLAAARCSHPQKFLAVLWGLCWVLIQPWRSCLQTHHQSSNSLNGKHNSKTYFWASFKSFTSF